MMHLVDNGQVPPGGWSHKEVDGMEFPIDKTTKFFDLNALVDEVKKYRQGTGGDLDVGWRERFINDLCREHSSYPCQHEAPFIERHITLADGARFLHTAANFVRNGGKYVEQQEAERRAEICVRCPHNRQIPGCLGCNNLTAFALDLIGFRKTQNDVNLHSCSNCACLLKLKVHVPIEVIDNDGVGEWPEWCWNRLPAPQDGSL